MIACLNGELTVKRYRLRQGRPYLAAKNPLMAGGGMKPDVTLGETDDDYGYNMTKDPVHVHDLQATILHCLGIDHTKLTSSFRDGIFD